MAYIGDYAAGDTIDWKFTTRATTGAPSALSAATVAVYKGNSTTEVTAGITLTASFDSVTGLNHVRLDTTADTTTYANGTSTFQAILSHGVVNSVTIAGEVVGFFTLGRMLKPTTIGRTLDVSTGGEAGLDWANVGSPTTAVDLSGTTIKTTQKVDVETIKTNPVVNGGTVTFPSGTLASTTNITAGTITTTTNLTNGVNVTSVSGDTTAADNMEAFFDGTGYAGTGNVIPTVTTLTNKTGFALSAAGNQSVADETLDRDMSVGPDNGTQTVRTPRQALRFLRNKWDANGADLEVFKEDDTTSSWTGTLTATANATPITGLDPAG
jgi:hypothetical protein